ncbi:hypothetical protein FQN49_006933 [Arthroderma sp. PD_2]|nr:hypothetical protein FQN49_006933 [Arthroderma sp. PD_2]
MQDQMVQEALYAPDVHSRVYPVAVATITGRETTSGAKIAKRSRGRIGSGLSDALLSLRDLDSWARDPRPTVDTSESSESNSLEALAATISPSKGNTYLGAVTDPDSTEVSESSSPHPTTMSPTVTFLFGSNWR